MKVRSKLWLRWLLCCAASFVALVGPLAAVLVAKRDVYFATVAEGVKISIGGSICMVLVALLIVGKLRVPGGVVALLFVCGLSWLLDAVLDDLFLLSCCALAGKVVDWIFFAPRLRRLRRLIDMHEQAEISAVANAKAMEGVLDKYTGRV